MSNLPPGWEMAALQDLVPPDRPICYGILMPKENLADGVPYVKVRDFPHDRINVAGLHRTSPVIADKYRRSSLRPDDVLVSIRGTVGRVAIVPAELQGANITQDTARVSPADGVDPRYLAMLLRSPDAQAYFKRVARGVAVKGVNIGDLKALKVPVAPLSAQRRIVAAIDEYLSRLDAASAALIVALARVEVLRAAAIRETFASHDWPWTTLGEVAELKGGVTKDAKRQTDPSYVEVPYLRVANVQRGYLDLENVTTIRVPPERAKALELQPGDVLFNEGGDRDKLGRGWIWEGQVPQCIHQNHVFRARLHRDDFDPRFLSTHGNTWGQRWFEEHGKQTTNLASINLATLKRFPVPAPPVAEQRKLMDQLELLEDKVRAIESAIEVAQRRSASLRRAVLDAAFSGRLVAHEAAEKPAPTLELKREPRPTNACKTTVQS